MGGNTKNYKNVRKHSSIPLQHQGKEGLSNHDSKFRGYEKE